MGLLQDSEAGRTSIGRGSVPDVLRARAAYALGLVAEGSRITDLRTYASRALVAAARAEEPAIDVQVAAIERVSPDIVASANPGCSMHLAGAGVDTVHPMELIDRALNQP